MLAFAQLLLLLLIALTGCAGAPPSAHNAPRQGEGSSVTPAEGAVPSSPGRDVHLYAIGKDLYAYIAGDDQNANSTFLVGRDEILVVDTGLDEKGGARLLAAIRGVSRAPVRYIINTHYHPDHQGGNAVVGPFATVISTAFTRERTLKVKAELPADQGARLRPAGVTFTDKLSIHVGDAPVEIYFPDEAHTRGDALVYFPRHRAIAMGDLFLNRSSPSMDEGSAESWIKALDQVLAMPVEAVVPGHFELATRKELQRFRDYLSDLYAQVAAMHRAGATVEQVRSGVHMEKYADFRQYPGYEATFADNAETVLRQLMSR